ncbi:DUF3105 domain-containing protein [Microbacterium sp. zg.Y1090]|uniref:DUF3105 domain-containing protein n=1 Tax=Microbacterium TaxID=33882 RepID=UPI00214D1006|nr:MULTISPECIES: DUF3105 domain-containing protein [unclassified Microbacterium]MCR2812631.1 DUF3105 domain-containing protein [Microbacterium sp. zg.Y1084]MCR2817574.1 DUF3105 domain-containing protein [Microbacterium sp. zg.Y1090]MDL5485784.1 DUF3105 domain-containing protein [Microbacterium sp. zg-Y1211]WIM28948.1 DUF3105 domain-containing protein [Microbacterium sp. zg-Y1090]
MTPTPPNKSQRVSGNPATQSKIALTAKQQREQQKQEKLAQYQRELAKRRRSKLVWWVVGSAAGIAIVGAIVASYMFTPKPVTYARGDGDGTSISGVETFENTANHVEGDVAYPQAPPAGGDHNAMWLNCGVYSEPVPEVNAVHSLEHGAVWVTYDPASVDQAGVDALESKLPNSYVILSPGEDLDAPVVASAWNAQIKLDSVDDPRLEDFLTAYWRNLNAPEPNAACAGALDAPGKQS